MEKQNAAAFFDCDGTLTPYTMVHSYLFMNSIRLKGIKKNLFLLKEFLQIPFYLVESKKDANAFDVKFHRKYKGFNYKKLCEYYNEAFEQRVKDAIFKEMRRRIQNYKKEGIKIVIISASPDLIIKPVADYLGADAYYARSLKVENGIVTGDLKPNFMKKIEKAKAILDYAEKNDIELSKSYAYGDSSPDIAMFNLVGNPVVVNGKKKLLEIAARKKWETLNLR